MKIAIIGAGISGLAAAAFLKRSGHDVTVYERFEAPHPVGSGLMLQPTGLAVLAHLGLDKAAIAASSPIQGIEGRVAGSEKVIFDVAYRTLSPSIFGLGIHRATLFSLLHDEARRQNVQIVTSAAISDVTYDAQERPLVGDGKNQYGPFDLVINAQGTRSPLRSKFTEVKKDRTYPYAAIWGVCRDNSGAFRHALYQRYVRARHMIGVMPVGKLNGDDCESVAFFWSLRADEYDLWREQGLTAWRRHVVALWPETEALVDQFHTLDDLSFATYGDVLLSKCHNHRIVFIGDAAHATSPQLGQGANMGLIDALALDESLRQTDDVNDAIKTFAAKRKRHVRFYQTASHWLTPFFQSDAFFRPFLRDATFGVMCKLPYLKTEMVRTLAGVKTGLFTSMNPGVIHPDYDLKSDGAGAASAREVVPAP